MVSNDKVVQPEITVDNAGALEIRFQIVSEICKEKFHMGHFTSLAGAILFRPEIELAF